MRQEAAPMPFTEADRQALVDDLQRNGEAVVATIAALPPASFLEGRYEGGWNGHDLVAHLASIEWTHPRLIDRLSESPAEWTDPGLVERVSDTEGEPPSSAPAGRAPIDDYNARQVAKRRDVPVADLIEEFRRNRAATIEAVRSLDLALFDQHVRSTGGSTGTLADVLRWVAIGHTEGHLADLAGPPAP
jgi:hypothetical protein